MFTGERLAARGLMAQALLEQGYSYRQIQKLTGVSLGSMTALKRRLAKGDCAPPARIAVEAVKDRLQQEFLRVAAECLGGVTPTKIKAASLGELVKAAAVAAERAGVGSSGAAQSPILVQLAQQFQFIPSQSVSRPVAVAEPEKSVEGKPLEGQPLREKHLEGNYVDDQPVEPNPVPSPDAVAAPGPPSPTSRRRRPATRAASRTTAGRPAGDSPGSTPPDDPGPPRPPSPRAGVRTGA